MGLHGVCICFNFSIIQFAPVCSQLLLTAWSLTFTSRPLDHYLRWTQSKICWIYIYQIVNTVRLTVWAGHHSILLLDNLDKMNNIRIITVTIFLYRIIYLKCYRRLLKSLVCSLVLLRLSGPLGTRHSRIVLIFWMKKNSLLFVIVSLFFL